MKIRFFTCVALALVAVSLYAETPSVSPSPTVSPSPSPTGSPTACPANPTFTRKLFNQIGLQYATHTTMATLRTLSPGTVQTNRAGNIFTFTLRYSRTGNPTGTVTLTEKYQCHNGAWVYDGSTLAGRVEKGRLVNGSLVFDLKFTYDLKHEFLPVPELDKPLLAATGIAELKQETGGPMGNWGCLAGKPQIHQKVSFLQFFGPLQIPLLIKDAAEYECMTSSNASVDWHRRKYDQTAYQHEFNDVTHNRDPLDRWIYTWEIARQQKEVRQDDGSKRNNKVATDPAARVPMWFNATLRREWLAQILGANGATPLVAESLTEFQRVYQSNFSEDKFDYSILGDLAFHRFSTYTPAQWTFEVECRNDQVCGAEFHLSMFMNGAGVLSSCTLTNNGAPAACNANTIPPVLGTAADFEYSKRAQVTVYPPQTPPPPTPGN